MSDTPREGNAPEAAEKPLRRTGVVRRGRSLARRQAALTAFCSCVAALAVAATALALTAANVREQTHARFKDLANERQRQLQMLVGQQYETVRQIASRSRLRALLEEELTSEPDEARTREMNAILADSAGASARCLRIDLVGGGQIVASSNPMLVGLRESPREVVPRGRSSPMMTEPYFAGRSVRASVVSPIAGADAFVVVEIDATDMMAVLEDVEPLGPGGQLKIVSAGKPAFAAAVGDGEGLAESGFRVADLRDERQLVYWQPVVFNPGLAEDWRLVASLPQSSANAPVRRLFAWLLPAVGLLTLAVTGFSYSAARRLGKRLERLTRAAVRTAESGKPHGVRLSGDDEVAKLADAFNAMGDRVKEDLSGLRREADHHRGEKDRMAEDLSVAGEIQRCLYPAGPLRVPGLEAVGDALPADLLCGDFFDYFEAGGDVYFALGDVSGHGVGPSLVMVEVRTVLRGLRWEPLPLLEITTRLNDRLVRETPAARFATLLLGRVDRRTGEVAYVGAGHRGLLVRRGGECEQLKSTGLVVGLVEGTHWTENAVRMEPGDLLCVASDGIEEMQNEAKQPYGWDSVCETIREARGRPLSEVVSVVLNGAAAHANGRAPKDDRTLLLLRRTAA